MLASYLNLTLGQLLVCCGIVGIYKLVVGCGWVGPCHCCVCNCENCVFNVLPLPSARELVYTQTKYPNPVVNSNLTYDFYVSKTIEFYFITPKLTSWS